MMFSRNRDLTKSCFLITSTACLLAAAFAQAQAPSVGERGFAWRTAGPIAAPRSVDGDAKFSIKDPSIVHSDGLWRLFCTVRGRSRSHGVVYLDFEDWGDASAAPQRMLPMHEGFFCAPQVFYFRPHGKWYLVCQASDERWSPEYQPAFSTADDVGDVDAWSPLTPIVGRRPQGVNAWLDFWVVCDESHAYLFFTSLDGKLHRSRTTLDAFPNSWSDPVVALDDDIFEAAHIYRLRGRDQYLAVIESQSDRPWRRFRAFVADRLDGSWSPIPDQAGLFASPANVEQTAGHWTDSISHGELIRSGVDERMEVDPGELRFVFQGVLDADRAGKPYGEIPWRLGLLESAPR